MPLENYFLPEDLERQIEAFINDYNHHRYPLPGSRLHAIDEKGESLGNLTPTDVYFGRDQAIINRRRRIKVDTMKNDAWRTCAKRHSINQREPEPPLQNHRSCPK